VKVKISLHPPHPNPLPQGERELWVVLYPERERGLSIRPSLDGRGYRGG